MLYLATASTQQVRDVMSAGLLGQLRQPDVGHAVVPGATWAADNGCFNAAKFTVTRWAGWLRRQPRSALWAAVPDVVGDHGATLCRWHDLAPYVTALGFPPAFVAQDGCTPGGVPIDAACVFVGGTTDWKLSTDAHAVVCEAKRRGLMTHMGRVNSLRRLRIAADWGCDTADGTFLAFGPDTNLPRLMAWVQPAQPGFFGGVA